MRIVDRLSRVEGGPSLSFEFFPPKSDEGERELFRAVEELARLAPSFVSVTYGAGGGTRDRTLGLVSRLRREAKVEAMAHLACTGHTEAELCEILSRLEADGVTNLLALRGDPPRDQPPREGGYRYASELVRLIRRRGHRFCVGAAAYPEGHMECPDRNVDMAHLKAKVDQGAEFLITQLFFDNAFYFDFVRRARQMRIRVPVVPGIMPITNATQIDRFTRLCGATVPMRLVLELERRRDDPEAVIDLGVSHALEQCRDLLERGAPGIHFYTLNRSKAVRRIVEALRADYPTRELSVAQEA
ncbi:MAG: methylenetetrahydrofolate reductase [NAD(P)H] [Deltaproteobacteria bacterium]